MAQCENFRVYTAPLLGPLGPTQTLPCLGRKSGLIYSTGDSGILIHGRSYRRGKTVTRAVRWPRPQLPAWTGIPWSLPTPDSGIINHIPHGQAKDPTASGSSWSVFQPAPGWVPGTHSHRSMVPTQALLCPTSHAQNGRATPSLRVPDTSQSHDLLKTKSL